MAAQLENKRLFRLRVAEHAFADYLGRLFDSASFVRFFCQMSDQSNSRYLLHLFNMVLVLGLNFLKALEARVGKASLLAVYKLDQLVLFVLRLLSKFLFLLHLKKDSLFPKVIADGDQPARQFANFKTTPNAPDRAQSRSRPFAGRTTPGQRDYSEDLLLVYFHLAQYVYFRLLFDRGWLDTLQNAVKPLGLIRQFLSSLTTTLCDCTSCVHFEDAVDSSEMTSQEKRLVSSRVLHQIAANRVEDIDADELTRLVGSLGGRKPTAALRRIKSLFQFDRDFLAHESGRVFFGSAKIDEKRRFEFGPGPSGDDAPCAFFLRKMALFKLGFALDTLTRFYAEALQTSQVLQLKHESLVKSIEDKFFRFQRDDRFRVLLSLKYPFREEQALCRCGHAECPDCGARDAGCNDLGDVGAKAKSKREAFIRKKFNLPRVERNPQFGRTGQSPPVKGGPRVGDAGPSGSVVLKKKYGFNLPRIENGEKKFLLRDVMSYRSIDKLIASKHIIKFKDKMKPDGKEN